MMEKNLENNGLTKEWLELELKRKGKKDIGRVLRGERYETTACL